MYRSWGTKKIESCLDFKVNSEPSKKDVCNFPVFM